MMDHRVFIGLGSNVGDPKENLKQALKMLAETEGIQVDKVSSLYMTEPVGYEDQPWFYNCVAQLCTDKTPSALLDILQDIENRLGRVRTIRWGPRTVDLDILLFDDLTIENDRLSVPHPRMLERAFVMVPLSEIAGDLMLSGGEKVSEAARKINDGKKYSYIQPLM